jgi:hypothetical protein
LLKSILTMDSIFNNNYRFIRRYLDRVISTKEGSVWPLILGFQKNFHGMEVMSSHDWYIKCIAPVDQQLWPLKHFIFNRDSYVLYKFIFEVHLHRNQFRIIAFKMELNFQLSLFHTFNTHLINDFNSRAIIQNWFQCKRTLL